MTAAGYVAVPETWLAGGRSFQAASEVLAKAADRLCAELTGAGVAWGQGDLGRPFFNGSDGKPGFGATRKHWLPQIGDMVNVLAGTGDAMVASGVRYAETEQANTIGAPPLGGVPSSVAGGGSYRMPSFTGGMAKNDPPPGELMQMLDVVESLVAGCSWPDGSTGGMGQIRDALSVMASAISEVITDVHRAVSEVRGRNSGQATDNFATFARVVVQALEQTQKACEGMSQSADTLRRQIDAARIQFVTGLVFLAASFIAAQALLIFTFGGSEAAFAETAEIEGLALRALVQMLARAVIEGLWYGAGMDAISQLSRMVTGLQHGFDIGELAKAGGEGALAGLVMGGLGAGARLGAGRSAVLDALTSAMESGGAKGTSARLAFSSATGFAGNVVSQAAFDDGHVNWMQAGQFAVGMGILGEGMDKLAPTPARAAPGETADTADGDIPSPADPGSPSPIQPVVTGDHSTADPAASPAQTGSTGKAGPNAISEALNGPSPQPEPGHPGNPAVASEAGRTAAPPTGDVPAGSEAGQGGLALAGAAGHPDQDAVVPAVVPGPAPDPAPDPAHAAVAARPDAAGVHPAVLTGAAGDPGVPADGAPLAVSSHGADAAAVGADGPVPAGGPPPGVGVGRQADASPDPQPEQNGADGRQGAGRDTGQAPAEDPGRAATRPGVRHRAPDIPASTDPAHGDAAPHQGASAVAVHPDIAAIDPSHVENIRRLNDAMRSGIASERTPGIEGRVADTAIVEFKDGSTWVRKTLCLSPEKSRSNDPDREELAYHVASALDANAPAVIRTSPEEFWMPFVKGKLAAEFPDASYYYGAGRRRAARYQRAPGWFADQYANTDRGLRIGIMDYLIGNLDRHPGNWLIGPDGQPIPIDHGRAWYRPNVGLGTMDGYPDHTPFTRNLTHERLQWLPRDQWNAMQRKLEALQPIFDGKGDEAAQWYQATMERFAKLRGWAGT